MSIAPRTDEPTRTSGCDRVARTSSTARSIQSTVVDRFVGADRDGTTHDHRLVGRRLVADGDPAHPVVDRTGDPRGADRVERIHRGDEPESGRGLEPTEPRHGDLAFAHHRDQHVQRLFGNAVEFLDVEQRTVAERRGERARDEDVGVVAVAEHSSRVEVADDAGRRELGVALDELESDPQLSRDRTQQRRLAGAGRPLDDDVAIGGDRCDGQFDLAYPTDDRRRQSVDELVEISAVGVLPVLRHPCRMTPRMFSPSRIAR